MFYAVSEIVKDTLKLENLIALFYISQWYERIEWYKTDTGVSRCSGEKFTIWKIVITRQVTKTPNKYVHSENKYDSLNTQADWRHVELILLLETIRWIWHDSLDINRCIFMCRIVFQYRCRIKRLWTENNCSKKKFWCLK